VRGLSAPEAALWARVARTVRPLGAKAKPSPPAPQVSVRPVAPTPPALSATLARTHPVDATLDGGWDKRIRKGRLVPDRVVDLHGYTRDAAQDVLTSAIRRAASAGDRVLLVVTGKGAAGGGVIRQSLPHWLTLPDIRPFVAAVRAAHPSHGGAGASYVVLRRR
jgi:DNA-nicking Smr family endonuclease